MSDVRRTTTASQQAVWAVLARPSTYPDWLVGAQIIRDVDGNFPEPGADFHHEVGASEDLALPDRTTALEADAPNLLKLKVRARPFFEGVVTFRLAPAEEGTEITMQEEPIGLLRFVAPLLSPLISARNTKSLEALCAYVEGDRSAPPAR